MSFHHTEKDDSRQLRLKQIRSLLPGEGISSDAVSGKFLVYKERGETLAMLVRRFREAQGYTASIPITYAGRLDPMAEGIVLLLVGEDRYKKDEYLTFTKTYEVEVLFGIATDTQDILGVVTNEDYRVITSEDVKEIIKQVPKIVELSYPKYSSIPVNGKPLFAHTRAGTSVVIPVKKVVITEAVFLRGKVVPIELIAREAIDDIGKVEGDFRQLMIMKQWREYTETHHDKEVLITTIRVSASSGTYMRSLATWIGEQLGVPALAYKIKRTNIGKYSL